VVEIRRHAAERNGTWKPNCGARESRYSSALTGAYNRGSCHGRARVFNESETTRPTQLYCPSCGARRATICAGSAEEEGPVAEGRRRADRAGSRRRRATCSADDKWLARTCAAAAVRYSAFKTMAFLSTEGGCRKTIEAARQPGDRFQERRGCCQKDFASP